MTGATTLTAPSAKLSREQTNGLNPFVPIPFQWRMLLIAYVVIYHILTPGLREIVANSSAPLSGARLFAEMIYQVLLFAPILFYRPRFGWLHPLIFPALFGLGKHLIKSPGSLLAPLRVGTAQVETLAHVNLVGFTTQELAWATLEHDALSILAILCYYGGFFFAQRFTSFDFKPLRLSFPKIRYRRITLLCIAGVAASAVVAGVYLQQQGGLANHMLSYWGGGRSKMRGELDGSVFFAISFGVIASLAWYALNDKASRNPLFWGAVVYAIPINFFITGSRSSVFEGVAPFLMIWMMRHRKMPRGRVIAIGFLALISIGVMGQFRSSAYSGRMDWSVFLETSVSDAVEQTLTVSENRQSVQGGVPVIARVPEDVGFLKGKTYLGGLFFFVPRFIWEDKPGGGGRHNSELILGRSEGSGAIPISEVAEAYWNFNIFGVVSIFFIFGMFHKGLACTLRRYPYMAVAVMYVFALFKLSPNGVALTTGSREVVAVIAFLFAVGALSWRRS